LFRRIGDQVAPAAPWGIYATYMGLLLYGGHLALFTAAASASLLPEPALRRRSARRPHARVQVKSTFNGAAELPASTGIACVNPRVVVEPRRHKSS
jgi:hypothetical protein